MNTEKIYSLLEKVLGKDTDEIRRYPNDASLSELGLNSIQFIQFIVAFEEAFDVEVLDSDLLLSNFDTLSKLFETLGKYTHNNAALKKVLVCDCDNVLWHGIAGEEELFLDEAVLNFQRELIRLYGGGILLCLCSRNEPEYIDEAFDRLDMPLRKDHFVSFRINRQDKAGNIQELAAELNLSADSFVFVDDSDYEIGLIQALLPEVTTIKADYSSGFFIEEIKVSFGECAPQENNRTRLYREQKEREKAKSHFSTVEDYNRSLDTVCICAAARPEQTKRIAELSQRTNQFNLSGNRYTADEVARFLSRSDTLVLSLSVTDIYGDMGIVGAAMVECTAKSAVIDSFFLSCRVFDRGFEMVLLDEIKKLCDGKALSGRYRSTGKNNRYSCFYPENGVSLL